MIAMVILSTLSTMIMIMIMMSICEYHDDLLAVRVNGVNDRTLDGAVLLASRLLRLGLKNWKITSCPLAGKHIQSH